jgi:hypothetical protein
VRAAEGRRVHDGRLGRAGGGWVVTPAAGAPVTVDEPPAALLEHAGRRVWVVLDDAGRVQRFGVID